MHTTINFDKVTVATTPEKLAGLRRFNLAWATASFANTLI